VPDASARLGGCGWLLVALASLLGCSSGEEPGSFAGAGGASASGPVVGGAPAAVNTAPREMEPLRGLLDGCALTPGQPEGPFYVPGALSRADIREDRQGAILRIRLWVNDIAGDCAPIPGSAVEVWHPDAQGIYSGVRDPNGRFDTTGQTFLRGIQQTDAKGHVEFVSIYPGWSEGRAPHVNFRVVLPSGESVTSEMYFPQDITEAIFRQQHYRPPNQDYVSNANDPVLTLIEPEARRILRAGVFIYPDGFVSELVVGVNP
jgi:protocatechuate 3,4-dioxygenase beta subunit